MLNLPVKNNRKFPGHLFGNNETQAKKNPKHKIAERFFDLPLDTLCITNMHGYFIKVSSSFIEMTGYTEKELTSRPFSDFVFAEDLIRTELVFNEVKTGKCIRNFENRYQCKDGSVICLEWHATIVPEEGLIYAIARDITKLKEAQTWLQQRTDELEEMMKQKEESLRYARYLQHAVNPAIEKMPKAFPESFLFFSPKEIVSGDFLWMETLPGKNSDKVLIAAADCTGHGVPAAILTVMCSNALNEAVREHSLTDPGKILDKVRTLVAQRFESADSSIYDGMDISLCLVDKTTGEIEWSGAHTPLYYIKNGRFYELNGDKQGIGKSDTAKPFTTHKLKLSKGDTIYLFSDGYASQFGGDKGKKLMFINFKKLLANVSRFDISEQKEMISSFFENWKQNLEQIDDVLVAGIQI